VRRGEVWWAEPGPPAGRRPVVLLSRDEAYAVRSLVTVAPVTTRIRNIPVEVPLGPEDGLPGPCVANLDTITTIALGSLQERIATLPPEKVQALDDAIRFALGLRS
jgi:mRNA interferase MazF